MTLNPAAWIVVAFLAVALAAVLIARSRGGRR